MRPARHRRARVYGWVRSAHLERAHALPPASILHRGWRYDLDPRLTEGLDLVSGGTISTAVTLLRSRLDRLEVLEPLVGSGMGRTALAIGAARLGAAVRGRELAVVSYAIENRDGHRLPPDASWRRRLRHRVRWALTRFVARRLDRLAFGTAAAAELYQRLLAEDLARCTTRLVPALPAPCDCPQGQERDEDLVLFLGAFVARKGLPQVVQAWPQVHRSRPSARLVVVGTGALEDQVRELADRSPEVDLVVDPPRAVIHGLLRRAAVLVLPSQPTPHWREQVGLPLVEGLAHGCSVVTTEETGIADWLRDHGHDVVPSSAGPAEIAAAVAGALARGRSAASVLADLPEVDGRLAADHWLMDGAAADQPGERHPIRAVR